LPAFPWGWAAGGVVTHALPTGCGTAVAWHNVLLKHPGAVPAGAGGLGGAIGEFAPFRWQKTHTVAFPSAVDVWT
jgi:hypothetical protein